MNIQKFFTLTVPETQGGHHAKDMENAEDFGYDDEEAELSRRLKLGGLAWRWSGDFFRPSVEIYKPDEEPKP